MTSEQEKAANLSTLLGMMTYAMVIGVWTMVEESSATLSPKIGDVLIGAGESSMGLKITAEKPDEILTQIGRFFVDSLGYCKDFKLEPNGNTFKVSLLDAIGTPETEALIKQHGITKLFSNPYMCMCLSALAKVGKKSRWLYENDVAGNKQIITFELL